MLDIISILCKKNKNSKVCSNLKKSDALFSLILSILRIYPKTCY